MSSTRAWPPVLFAMLVAGCGSWGRGTPPADAPYLSMRYCGVAFDGRAREARFSIDFAVVRPLPPGSTVEVTFDNPLDAAAPLAATRVVKGGERTLRVESPPVKGIEPREYGMSVRIYQPADRRLIASRAERCAIPVGQLDAGIEFR